MVTPLTIKLKKIIEFGLYLLIFLLPWQTRWIIKAGELNGGYSEYSTISLYATDILLITLILLFVIYWIKNKRFKFYSFDFAQDRDLRFKSIWWWIAGLELIVFLSIFVAIDKELALFTYGRFLLGVGLFWLIVSANYDRFKLIICLILGGTLQAVIAIWQFLSQSSLASKWLGMAMHDSSVLGVSVIETLNGGRWLRAYGGMDHPNILGGFLAIVLLFSVLLLLNNKLSKLSKLSLLISSGLILMALFFTFSRGAWGALLGGVVVLLIMVSLKKERLHQKKLLILIFIFSLFIFGLINIYSDLVLTRLSKDTRLEIKSNVERVSSYKQAKDIILENPVLGVGIGNYTLVLNEKEPDLAAHNYQPVHNLWLLLLAEVGILGLILFLMIIALIGYKLILKFKINRNYALIIIFSLLIASMVDHWWWSLHFGIMFTWLLLGFLARED